MFADLIYDILIALFLVAVGVHIRGAYALAQKQKSLATRLDAQLIHWKSEMVSEEHQRIFYEDEKIQALKQALLSTGEKNTCQEVSKIKDEVYQEMEKDYVEHHKDSLIKKEAVMLRKQVEIFPEGISFLHRQAEASIQNILNGNLFVSDSDAGTLGYSYVRTCLRLKTNMVAFLKEQMQSDSLMVSDDGKFRDEIKLANFSCRWRIILILADMDILSGKVKLLEDRKMYDMVWRNFWGKPAG